MNEISNGRYSLTVPKTCGKEQKWYYDSEDHIPRPLGGNVLWNEQYPKKYREEQATKSYVIRHFQIASDIDKFVNLKGGEFLGKDSVKFFKTKLQVFSFLEQESEYFNIMISGGERYPIIPFMDLERGPSVAYVTREKYGLKKCRLHLETYNQFKEREFRIFTRPADCPTSDLPKYFGEITYHLFYLGEKNFESKN